MATTPIERVGGRGQGRSGRQAITQVNKELVSSVGAFGEHEERYEDACAALLRGA